ncbi:hypothetical protein GCM10025789_06650 [Tessaracoccus lubricantis]|uniref:Glycosyl transferase family 1 domain-containing protein n=2 Tax=Tessaracoccus lubricantis TaxID=545543 RepID=A0ABP9F2F6_9ACTN
MDPSFDGRPSRRLKVLFTVNIASPYRVDFFNELGRFCDLTVLFERKIATDRDVAWRADNARTFKAVHLSGLRTASDKALCPGVVKYLLDPSFDVIVIGGYGTPSGMLSVGFLRLLGRPYVLNIDGGFPKQDAPIIGRLKRVLIGGASFYLSPSLGASDYLMHYGVPSSAIHQYPFASVSERNLAKRPPNAEEKQRLRDRLGIEERLCVLAVGQYIHRKGFDLLIRAAGRLGNEVGVYIVGGSPTEFYLNLSDRTSATNVKFVDFRDSRSLQAYYQAADVLAMPTRYDVWGLVVGEAMAQALPVVSSNRCGAALEMITNGANGLIIPSESVELLAEALDRTIGSSLETRQAMAESALATARRFTIERMASEHLVLFHRIVQNRSKCWS